MASVLYSPDTIQEVRRLISEVRDECATLGEELTERDAYIIDALTHLDELASLIYDGLTGVNDLYLKTSLLLEADAVRTRLTKALS